MFQSVCTNVLQPVIAQPKMSKENGIGKIIAQVGLRPVGLSPLQRSTTITVPSDEPIVVNKAKSEQVPLAFPQCPLHGSRIVHRSACGFGAVEGVTLVGLWGDSRIMAAAPLLSGYGYLGSIGVMMPTLSSKGNVDWDVVGA